MLATWSHSPSAEARRSTAASRLCAAASLILARAARRRRGEAPEGVAGALGAGAPVRQDAAYVVRAARSDFAGAGLLQLEFVPAPGRGSTRRSSTAAPTSMPKCRWRRRGPARAAESRRARLGQLRVRRRTRSRARVRPARRLLPCHARRRSTVDAAARPREPVQTFRVRGATGARCALRSKHAVRRRHQSRRLRSRRYGEEISSSATGSATSASGVADDAGPRLREFRGGERGHRRGCATSPRGAAAATSISSRRTRPRQYGFS